MGRIVAAILAVGCLTAGAWGQAQLPAVERGQRPDAVSGLGRHPPRHAGGEPDGIPDLPGPRGGPAGRGHHHAAGAGSRGAGRRGDALRPGQPGQVHQQVRRPYGLSDGRGGDRRRAAESHAAERRTAGGELLGRAAAVLRRAGPVGGRGQVKDAPTVVPQGVRERAAAKAGQEEIWSRGRPGQRTDGRPPGGGGPGRDDDQARERPQAGGVPPPDRPQPAWRVRGRGGGFRRADRRGGPVQHARPVRRDAETRSSTATSASTAGCRWRRTRISAPPGRSTER